MPFFADTPEARIGRSDSKNPSTTCRGITSNGRPCRRPIEAQPPPRTKAGRLRADDPSDEQLYCWQHKEQAGLSARSSPGPKTSKTTPTLVERTSLDTLADRLGLVAQGRAEKAGRPGGGKQQQRPKKATRPTLLCCCFRVPIEDASPAPRPKPQTPPRPASSAPSPTKTSEKKKTDNKYPTPSPSPNRPSKTSPNSAGRHSRRPSGSPSPQPAAAFFSLIPPSASPQTASALLAELAKPISAQDEAGYIYMFWLTPESKAASPPADAARSLLAPPPGARSSPGRRRPSDVLASFAAASPPSGSRGGASPGRPGGGKKTLLLKIGRANNVQRRLNEWTRQCGYDLSLIRYYPYISSGSPAAATSAPRKMPHSHRVERLIHLELAGRGQRVSDRQKCPTCGREHREWFEVEATRDAVASVDEVIRRWSEWDEGRG